MNKSWARLILFQFTFLSTILASVIAYSGAEVVTIPSGSFWMGCAALDTQCSPSERPGQMIQLPTFKINKFEVTQAQYGHCIKAKKCSLPNENFDPRKKGKYPVTNVTWFQATEFCKWAKMRLPTSAEWEKAARGSDQRIFSWGNEKPDCARANSSSECGYKSKPVGTSAGDVSPYGVYDMTGNVEEWVNDWYATNYYSDCPSNSPQGPLNGSEKVVRGGAFNSDSWHSRLSFRFYAAPKQADDYRGFRCAKFSN